MKIEPSRPSFLGLCSFLILPLLILVACQPALDSNTAAFVTTEISVIPAATIASVPSPIPTLSLVEKEAIASELYRTNENCKLPCFWGIIPGETKWETVEPLLNAVATVLLTNADSELDTAYTVSVDLPVSQELSRREVIAQHYLIENGIVTLIESASLRPSSKIHSVSEILNTYGRPAEVKIDTYGYSHGEINLFHAALFYPEKGILVAYGSSADFIDDYVQGCIQNSTGAVVVWAPEKELSFAEALNGTRGLGTFGEQYYKPLQEATDMDIETFYQTYLDPDTDTCIETPAELWMDR
ncbi:MAG: hypothetical protein H6667_23735 [Ardenticatenaceae bacterium]|nr:hypothetical protein [Ardenticatenaceae bacterium]